MNTEHRYMFKFFSMGVKQVFVKQKQRYVKRHNPHYELTLQYG